jgi:hypothetical protein
MPWLDAHRQSIVPSIAALASQLGPGDIFESAQAEQCTPEDARDRFNLLTNLDLVSGLTATAK